MTQLRPNTREASEDGRFLNLPDHPSDYDDLSDKSSEFPKLDLREPGAAGLTTVSPDQCVVHLKFLVALADLRETVSSQDGLFSLFDKHMATNFQSEDSQVQALARLKEKRWAVYTASAVDRFTTWWKVCVPKCGNRVTIDSLSGPNYPNIVKCDERLAWSGDKLPPLGK